jgi:hypothetical protein
MFISTRAFCTVLPLLLIRLTNDRLYKLVSVSLMFLCLNICFSAKNVLGQLQIIGPQRVDASGRPINKGSVYFPNGPMADGFTLICPNDTHGDQHYVRWKVGWSKGSSCQVDVDWGLIFIKIQEDCHYEIGKEYGRELSYNYGPSPEVSIDYMIWTQYGAFKYWGTDAAGKYFEAIIYLPEGTWTDVNIRPPYCRPKMGAARDSLEFYRSGLAPGHLRDTCDSALAAMDQAHTAPFGEVAARLFLASSFLITAVNDYGGDEPTLDTVLTLATSTLDILTQQILDFVTGGDPSTGGAYSDSELVPEISSVPLADSVLRLARDTLNNQILGIERFSSVIPLYSRAVVLCLDAHGQDKSYHSASPCTLLGYGDVPGPPCHEIPTLTEWGLIIFGVVLLGFISWVFLRRRKVIGVRS